MNLFFYLQTFILNYSFIAILSDHIFCTLFYQNTTLCKMETCEKRKKKPERSRSVLGRFYCTYFQKGQTESEAQLASRQMDTRSLYSHV